MSDFDVSTRDGFTMTLKLDGSYAVLHGLGKLQPEVKEATLPELRRIADDIRKGAKARIDTNHPHNLWRQVGTGSRLTPRYAITRPGTYWFRISTPAGEVGKAEAMGEFMNRAVKPSGAALISALNRLYGRDGTSGNGRILWQTRDDMDSEIQSRLEAAIAAASAKIQQEVDSGL